MKIGNQINQNEGDVYNIENIYNAVNSQHLDVSSYLVEEKLVSGNSVNRYKQESSLILWTGILGFITDILGIFPRLNFPWWVWIIGFILVFFYLGIRYGDAFGISTNKSIQVHDDGRLVLSKGENFSLNRSEAPCVYPNCNGYILPINIPEQYDGPYKVMGKCSHAGLQHGYVIDNNLQAYPMDIFDEFNVSPEEQS